MSPLNDSKVLTIPEITHFHYDGDPTPRNYPIAPLPTFAFSSFSCPVIINRAIHYHCNTIKEEKLSLGKNMKGKLSHSLFLQGNWPKEPGSGTFGREYLWDNQTSETPLCSHQCSAHVLQLGFMPKSKTQEA